MGPEILTHPREQFDRCLCKHYLPTTTFVGGNYKWPVYYLRTLAMETPTGVAGGPVLLEDLVGERQPIWLLL